MSRVLHYSGAFLIKDAKILASSRVVRLASVLVEFRSAAFVLRDASPVHIQIARVAAAASVTVLAGTLVKLRGTRQILRHAAAAFVHSADATACALRQRRCARCVLCDSVALLQQHAQGEAAPMHSFFAFCIQTRYSLRRLFPRAHRGLS